MRLHPFRIERGLQHEVVEPLDDEQRSGDNEHRVPCGHPLDRRHHAHEDRHHAADERAGVGHDVHHAHDEPDEEGVLRPHTEEDHRDRNHDHQDAAFAQDSCKVAHQQLRDGGHRPLDIAVYTLREGCFEHRQEQLVVFEEEKGDERDRKEGDHGRKRQTDDRRKGRIDRIVIEDALEPLDQRIGQRKTFVGQGEQIVEILLHTGDRLLDGTEHRTEVERSELVEFVEDQRDEERTRHDEEHPDQDQRRQRRRPAGKVPAPYPQPRQTADQRFEDDRQQRRHQNIDDDRTEIPHQERHRNGNQQADGVTCECGRRKQHVRS